MREVDMSSGTPVRVGIVGAGVSGVTALHALRKQGITAVAFERRSTIAGLWNSGYDSLHLFTSKTMASFPGYPMPEDYPLFPSRDQFRRYICAFVADKGLSENIQLDTEVIRMAAVAGGRGGWLLELDSGQQEHFDAIVLADGHLSKPAPGPEYPGEYAGLQMHTSDYRSAAQFEGDTLLVVGSGTSATDVATDGVAANKTVLMSVRSPRYFIPTSVGARTRMDISIPRFVPRFIQNALDSALVSVTTGRPEPLGMPKTSGGMTKTKLTMSTLVPYWIQRGRIRIVPEIASFAGTAVTFKDGSSANVQTIVWANGYQAEIPFLEDGTISWIDGMPARVVGGTLSPDAPNLYYNGWVSAIGSSSQLYSSSAELIAKMILAQQRIAGSLYEQVFSDEKPSGQIRFDLIEWRDILVAAERRLSTVLGTAPPRRRDFAERYPWARRRLSVF
jgi:hypothetical protein